MRRTILFSLIALFAVTVANDACAQHRGVRGSGSGRRGHGFSRARAISPYGFGYAYGPYDSGVGYDDAAQPGYFVQQPTRVAEPAAPPAVKVPGHPVVTEYKWPGVAAASVRTAPSPTSETEPQTLAIVLKDGSTLSAVTVFASADGLHYVDPDERHLLISMSTIDRPATLKLNRARNLNLHLPAAQ